MVLLIILDNIFILFLMGQGGFVELHTISNCLLIIYFCDLALKYVGCSYAKNTTLSKKNAVFLVYSS